MHGLAHADDADLVVLRFLRRLASDHLAHVACGLEGIGNQLLEQGVLGFGLVVFLGPLIAALDAVPPESIVSWALGFAACGGACFVGANALGDWYLGRYRR